ncbi:Hypothetical predicted protein [Pelobates cultripes]|uniref:Uncharacterized protein n=1 Tax=Pelobates cultripes TaxID=61616 RepID=A0AAD1SFS2_PELCU|nr:Hypothetical predicted protein [Pelobates cultripes]
MDDHGPHRIPGQVRGRYLPHSLGAEGNTHHRNAIRRLICTDTRIEGARREGRGTTATNESTHAGRWAHNEKGAKLLLQNAPLIKLTFQAEKRQGHVNETVKYLRQELADRDTYHHR